MHLPPAPEISAPVAAASPAKPTVLIYRERLLPYSETFILSQGESCQAYRCLYVGLSANGQTADLTAVPAGKRMLLPELTRLGQLWKLVYRLWGAVPPVWKQALLARQPQLIHAHFGPDGGFATSLARALRLPLIVTFHGYDATWRSPARRPNPLDLLWRRGQFFRALALERRRVPFQSASYVIAVSDFIRRQLIALGCPPDKIVVHYTGIDLEQFQPDGAIERQPMVLFVGRLVEKKGCSVLLKAMAQVQAVYPAAQLAIVGEGTERSYLQAQARSLGLARCQFSGIQTPAQVRAWMNRAWLLCAPSLTARSGDAEGLGTALLEAQAMELPVVATRSGGIPEAVRDGGTGLLVPENDPAALAAAILRLLTDRALRDRLGQAGRARAIAQFDIRKNTPKLEALYDADVKGYPAP